MLIDEDKSVLPPLHTKVLPAESDTVGLLLVNVITLDVFPQLPLFTVQKYVPAVSALYVEFVAPEIDDVVVFFH